MLDELMALFLQRFGLKEPDDSAGCKAIQGAMRGEVSIPSLRAALSGYELYSYEARVEEILNELAGAEVVTPVAAEAPASTGKPVAARKRAGRKTK